MFKKREKGANQLKRTHEDRYLDESASNKHEIDDSQTHSVKRLKTEVVSQDHHKHCNHDHKEHSHKHQQPEKKAMLKASTKEHQHYREDYIKQEIGEMASFKPTAEKQRVAAAVENATKQIEIDTAYENDAWTHAKQNIEISKGLKEGKLEPGIYRGQHGYQNYFEQTEEDLKRKKFQGTLGPLRAPTFIRNTTRVDYNPERCKDYYETGRCNFGDSCVFIHDRGDYKSGYQLDQEWEAQQKKKQLRQMGHEVEDDEENYEIHSQDNDGEDGGLPFKCRICEEVFRNPVQTQCGHYFCEACALTHYSQSGNCYACGKPTHGIFNEAPKLLAKLKELKKEGDQQQSQDEDDSHNHSDDSDQEERAAAKTAVTSNKQKRFADESEESESGGVLSKKDMEVFQEYRQRAKEVEGKKYQPQSGWYIP